MQFLHSPVTSSLSGLKHTTVKHLHLLGFSCILYLNCSTILVHIVVAIFRALGTAICTKMEHIQETLWLKFEIRKLKLYIRCGQ
jgi:hypothetical protein